MLVPELQREEARQQGVMGGQTPGGKAAVGGPGPYPDAPDAVLPPEFTPILEPANAGAGAARGWAAKLHRVPRRDCIQFLVHPVRVSPVRSWGVMGHKWEGAKGQHGGC